MKNNEVREKGFERQWSDQKKSHKKEDVKRKETMRREKKEKEKFHTQYRGNGKLSSNWEQISRN